MIPYNVKILDSKKGQKVQNVKKAYRCNVFEWV